MEKYNVYGRSVFDVNVSKNASREYFKDRKEIRARPCPVKIKCRASARREEEKRAELAGGVARRTRDTHVADHPI
ncbi:hypothetical protein KM043_004809 [Ampulex compressa]|nr:hypothetical protein KM043_004809 [Ampulex compressa]